MSLESEAHGLTQALNQVCSAALALNRSGTRNTADMTEVLRQIDNLTAARRIRLHLATACAGRHMDRALHGGVLTVGFTLFFGSENLARVSMTGVLSLLVTWLSLSLSPSTIHSPARSTSTPMRSPRCSRNLASRQPNAA